MQSRYNISIKKAILSIYGSIILKTDGIDINETKEWQASTILSSKMTGMIAWCARGLLSEARPWLLVCMFVCLLHIWLLRGWKLNIIIYLHTIHIINTEYNIEHKHITSIHHKQESKQQHTTHEQQAQAPTQIQIEPMESPIATQMELHPFPLCIMA